jgi:hypothetical protein
MDDSDITFAADEVAISHLGGRSYMAPCSPWFFTVCRRLNRFSLGQCVTER